MDKIKLFLQQPEVIFVMMILCVLIITAIIKLPIKHFTNKIKNEKKRKAINAVFVVIAVGVGILVEYVYAIITKTPFHLKLGAIFALLGMSSYNLYKKASDVVVYVFECVRSKKPIKIKKVMDIVSLPDVLEDGGQTTEEQSDNTNKKNNDNVELAKKEFEDMIK